MQEVNLALLSTPVCIYVWPLWELNKNPTQQTKMPTHPAITLIALCLCSWLSSHTSKLWMSNRHLSSFSSGLAGFCGHSSLCGLHTNIDKERSPRHSGAAPKMPPIHEHTERPTHIHPYAHRHATSQCN